MSIHSTQDSSYALSPSTPTVPKTSQKISPLMHEFQPYIPKHTLRQCKLKVSVSNKKAIDKSYSAAKNHDN